MKKKSKPKNKLSFETQFFGGYVQFTMMSIHYNPLPDGLDHELNERINEFRDKQVRITIQEI